MRPTLPSPISTKHRPVPSYGLGLLPRVLAAISSATARAADSAKTPAFGGPGLGTITERVDASERSSEGDRVHLYPPVLGQPGLYQHVGRLVHRDADEQVVRLVMVLEMRHLAGRVDAVDASALGELDAPQCTRLAR
jgi:hypothetical protein